MTKWKALLLALLLLLSATLGGAGTYFLFPTTVIKEPEEKTIAWAIGQGYHYAPTIIIQHLGLLEKYSNGKLHIDVTILKGPAMAEGMISGTLTFTHRSAPSFIQMVDTDIPVKVFGSVGTMEHKLYTSNPNIKSLENLTLAKGINVHHPKAIEYIGLKMALERIGINLDDLNLVFLDHSDAYQAMLQGEIDVEYTGAPYSVRYEREPDKFHYLGCDTDFFEMTFPTSVVLAMEDVDPELLAIATAAWFESITWINNHLEETAEIVAEYYHDETPDPYQDMLDSDINYSPMAYLDSLAPLSVLLAEAEVVERAYSSEELLFETAQSFGGL